VSTTGTGARAYVEITRGALLKGRFSERGAMLREQFEKDDAA